MTIRRTSSDVSVSSHSGSYNSSTHNPAPDDSSQLSFNSLIPNRRDNLLYDEDDPVEVSELAQFPGTTQSSGIPTSQKDSTQVGGLQGSVLIKYMKGYLGEESDRFDMAQFFDLSKEFDDLL